MLGDSGAVKYFDEIIAVDLIDFINKMMVNPNYFIYCHILILNL